MTALNEFQTATSENIDELREQYFTRKPGLPANVVSRKIWAAMRTYRRSIPSIELEDIHQSAYVKILKDFSRIVSRFAVSGRERTKANFEAWLTTCIRHVVVDVLRRQPPRLASLEEFGGLDFPTPTSDPGLQMRMSLLFAAACESLTPIEREIVEKRLAEKIKPDVLASEYNLTTVQIYKRLYAAKLKLRNELIRLIVEEKLNGRVSLRARFESIIESRCTLRKRCFFFRDPCPFASLAGSALHASAKSAVPDFNARTREFAELVCDLLDAWNLPPSLDRCYWAAGDHRGRKTPSRVS